MDIPYEKILNSAVKSAKLAGEYMLAQANSKSGINIDVKSKNDFVTNVDRESERIIVSVLKQDFPDFGVLAEENVYDKFSFEKPYWVIDPIDGTSNFIHGFPMYCVSIGLCMNKESIAGVIYDPCRDELFSAYKSGGAYLNGEKIGVSSCGLLSGAMIATGFPFRSYTIMKEYLECVEDILRNSHDIRRAGSAALDLAYVACGRLDGFWEYGLQPWDVAAGAVILKEAGGKLTDFSGGGDYLYGRTMVASNTKIHSDFFRILSKHLPKKYL